MGLAVKTATRGRQQFVRSLWALGFTDESEKSSLRRDLEQGIANQPTPPSGDKLLS